MYLTSLNIGKQVGKGFLFELAELIYLTAPLGNQTFENRLNLKFYKIQFYSFLKPLTPNCLFHGNALRLELTNLKVFES